LYKRILITGAAGAIGSTLRRGLRGRYPLLRLSDVAALGAADEGEEIVPCELGDLNALADVCRGCDAVLHFGGTPREASWEVIHANNIVGAYNMFEAARRQGVRRFIYASSNHVIGFHPQHRPVDSRSEPRPDTRYGVSKVYGEALGRLYADKHGMEVICLRIGSFRPKPTDVRMLCTWLSPDDMVRLAIAALEARNIHFEVVYGVSANTRTNWDLSGAERLGYRPQDNAESYAEEILQGLNRNRTKPLKHTWEMQNAWPFQGGSYCDEEFSGDISRID
jgi:uronate dehydrogenase